MTDHTEQNHTETSTSRPRHRGGKAFVGGVIAASVAFGTVGVVAANHSFNDVPASSPFHDQVSWMAETGLSTGFGDGTYRPSDAVTRGQMSAFLERQWSLRDPVAVAGSADTNVIDAHPDWETDLSTTIVVPPGTTATIIATYSAESACNEGDSSEGNRCYMQMTMNDGAMEPDAAGFSFDSDAIDGDDLWESHSFQRYATDVAPGTYTVEAQAVTQADGQYWRLDDRALTVTATLNPNS